MTFPEHFKNRVFGPRKLRWYKLPICERFGGVRICEVILIFENLVDLGRRKWLGVRERLGQPAGTPVCVCLWQMAVLDYSRCLGSF